ncbi:MAG: hypothetical protein JOY99_17910 [Sphingomonadaceae bacterium]|nr:hypothetical protein [Sphingomonadaceae bacterium]
MFSTVALIALGGIIIGGLGVIGWMFTTWYRIKHGYPLDGSDGAQVFPTAIAETTERVRLLTTENAQLRAELGAIKDRLATVERIVTDSSYRLDREFDALRGSAN